MIFRYKFGLSDRFLSGCYDQIHKVLCYTISQNIFNLNCDKKVRLTNNCFHMNISDRDEGECCAIFRRIYRRVFPYGCKVELKEQIMIAWPIVSTVMFQCTCIYYHGVHCLANRHLQEEDKKRGH